MIITLRSDVPDSTRSAIRDGATVIGSLARELVWPDGTIVVAVEGDVAPNLLDLPGVVAGYDKHKNYMMASKLSRETSIVRVGDVEIGGDLPVIMAGPCVVEDLDSTIEIARSVRAAGGAMLRGGAYKPRTSPYAFQGHGETGLRYLAAAREETGLPVVTEVMEPEQVDLVARYADMLQIGSRNMQNYPLLRRVGQSHRPVLLKRGFQATVDEWLMAAEYILAHGNPNVVLCERGIRAFDPAFRFTLDLNAVPMVKELSHLPVIVDPSHGTGKRSLVAAMSMAAIASGADGLMLEVHPNPDMALCDGAQTITPAELESIAHKACLIREIASGTPIVA